MKSIIKIYFLLFSFLILIGCEGNEYDIVNEIPIEDRCIFTIGDTLLYSCNDGSTDTVCVREIEFWTETGTTTGWFGGSSTYSTDRQRIIIECSNGNWNIVLKNILTSPGIDSPCYIIEAIESYRDGNPWCMLINGCEYPGGLIIAESMVDYNETKINNKIYNKVYYHSRVTNNNGYKIYWNLKYGIIHFVGISNGSYIVWDLESSV